MLQQCTQYLSQQTTLLDDDFKRICLKLFRTLVWQYYRDMVELIVEQGLKTYSHVIVKSSSPCMSNYIVSTVTVVLSLESILPISHWHNVKNFKAFLE